MDIERIRNNFPYLKSNKIYFNHASIGPLSQKVVNRINEFITLRSIGEIENYPTFLEVQTSVKQKLGSMLNADPDRIGFIDSVSNCFNLLAQGLSWKTGDQIILNDIEFPANVYPFLNLKNQGVEIDFAKSRNGKVLVDDIEKLITPKTKLISISLVQFLSGFKADIEIIGQLCKQNNIILSVDVIQGAGAVDIDVKISNIDFLSGGSHKWLMGLQGSSYLYITEELQKRIIPKYIGWLSIKNMWDFTDYKLDFLDTAEKFQNGSLNTIGYVAFDESLSLFDSIGYSEIEKRIHSNSTYFTEKLLENGIKPLLYNVEEKNLAGIITLELEDSERIQLQLKQKGIIFSVREGKLRFSPHFYNTEDEIEIVVKELVNAL